MPLYPKPAAGGGGTPGGSSGQLQFNNAGAFGGVHSVRADGAITYTYGAALGSGSGIITFATSAVAGAGAGTGTWFFGDALAPAIVQVVAKTFAIFAYWGGAAQYDLKFSAGDNTLDLQSGYTIRFFDNVNIPASTPDAGISRNAAGVLEINSTTVGTFRDLKVRALRGTAVTFANAIAAPPEGTLQSFTDSTTNVWGATITGGGANHVLGYFNGTNWTVAAK